MAEKSRTFDINIVEKGGAFQTWFKKFEGNKEDYDFEGLLALRRLLNNEKARMINVIRLKKPKSVYELAKILKRDFKSVADDIKLLERFGIVEMISEKTGQRIRHRPAVVVDTIYISLKV